MVPGLVVTVGGNLCVVTSVTSEEIVCHPPVHYEALTPEGYALILVCNHMSVEGFRDLRMG